MLYLLMTAEVASLVSLVVSWGLLAIIVNWMISFYLIRQINDDDDDDDEKKTMLAKRAVR